MPKTRNYSDIEKRDAMDLLQIHDDISTVHLLTGSAYPSSLAQKLRRKNATLSEKSFSLSAKRTMSDKAPIIQQHHDNHTLTLGASNQAPADANAASEDSEKANSDRYSPLLLLQPCRRAPAEQKKPPPIERGLERGTGS